MPDLTQEAVADQATGETESSAQASGGGQAEAIGETRSVQATQEANADGEQEGSTLPPELAAKEKELMRGFHEKTQALAKREKELMAEAESFKSESETLRQLVQTEWFQKASKAEKDRRTGVSQEMTDEDFEAIRSDKRAFNEYLKRRDESFESKIKSEIARVAKATEALHADKEMESLAKTYGEDFTKLKDEGALDKYLKQGYGYEDAFIKADYERSKSSHSQKLTEEAQRLITAKKAGSVDKPGVTRVSGSQVFKAKNKSFSDVFDRVMDAARQGQRVEINTEE